MSRFPESEDSAIGRSTPKDSARNGPGGVGLAVAGIGAYVLFVRWSLLALRPLIGSHNRERRLYAVRLARGPYFAGGIVECLAGALTPQGWLLVALSAAASTLGGSSALLWAPNWLRGKSIPPGPDASPVPIPRSWLWIGAAAVIGVSFILILGPGVRFARD
jgi:hypothetical protein